MTLARSAAATMSSMRQLSDDGADDPENPSVGGSDTVGTSVSARTPCDGVVVELVVVEVLVVVEPLVVDVVEVEVVELVVVDVPVVDELVVVDVPVVVVVVVVGVAHPLLKMAWPATVQFRPRKK